MIHISGVRAGWQGSKPQSRDSLWITHCSKHNNAHVLWTACAINFGTMCTRVWARCTRKKIRAFCTNPTAHSFVLGCMIQDTTYSVQRSVYCVHMCSIKMTLCKNVCHILYVHKRIHVVGCMLVCMTQCTAGSHLSSDLSCDAPTAPSSSSPAWSSSRC